MSVTLAELRTHSRNRADMKNSEFIEDSELNDYINNSVAELYDLLVEQFGSDYFINAYEFSTVSNEPNYTLPADFYKLTGVDSKLNAGDWTTLKKFNFNERNRYQDFSVWNLSGVPSIRYRLVGSNLNLSPIPTSATPMKLWYVPLAVKLSADGDTLKDLNGYSEYVIVDAAIKMLQKEESDVSVLMAQKAGLEKRIREMAKDRDAAEPDSVTDIYAENDNYFYKT